jgi:hypothetical protein
MPPQPQLLRLAASLRTRQTPHFHQHKRTPDDGQRSAAAAPFVQAHLGMQPFPGANAHRAVALTLQAILVGRFGPRLWILTAEPLSVTTRTTSWGRRTLRVGIEAAPRAQPNQKLHARAFEPLLDLHRIVEKASKTKSGTAPSVANRSTIALTCSVAILFWFSLGWRRLRSIGAAQESRSKLSCAMNW